MGNPGGFIDILDWVATYEHLQDDDDYQNTTIEEALGDEFPMTHFPCAVLEMAAWSAEQDDDEDICVDLLRLNPLMRNECGCPPLPPPPPGFENPFDDVSVLEEASASSVTTEETTSMSEDTNEDDELEDPTETSSDPEESTSGEEPMIVQEPSPDSAPEDPTSISEAEGTLEDSKEGSPYPPVVVESNNSKSTPIIIALVLVFAGAAAVLGIYMYTKHRGVQGLSVKMPDSSSIA